jgi:putative MATE family efflux protein
MGKRNRAVRKRNIDLLEGPVGSTLLRLAGPMTLGFVAVILFNVVDTFWVGRLGATELAAMSFTFPVIFFIMSIAIGIGVGMTAVVARVIGEGDSKQVRRLTTDGLFLANVIVVIVAISGLVTIRPLFGALGASPDIIDLIQAYMVPWYLGIGFLVIPMVGNAAIRATGDTKTPSLIMIIAGGLNLILDPLLIFGIGPFPRLELQGAAIASVIAYAVTFVAALWILGKREHMLDLSRPPARLVMESWRRILYVGAPAAGTQMLVPLGNGILTRLVSGFGPDAVAAFGVGARIESLSLIGLMALSASIAPFVGQNLGARSFSRVRAALRFTVRTSLVYGLVAATVLALLSRVIASLFSSDPLVVDLTSSYLYLVPISYGMFGVMFAVTAMFNAVNQPLKSTLIISMRLFVFAVPLAFAGSLLWGVPGLFLGIAIANVLVGAAALVLKRQYFRLLLETATQGQTRN